MTEKFLKLALKKSATLFFVAVFIVSTGFNLTMPFTARAEDNVEVTPDVTAEVEETADIQKEESEPTEPEVLGVTNEEDTRSDFDPYPICHNGNLITPASEGQLNGHLNGLENQTGGHENDIIPAVDANNDQVIDDLDCAFEEEEEEDNDLIGSITICKIVLDSEGNVVTGEEGTTFSVEGFTPDPVTLQGAPVAEFPETNFETPISMNSDILEDYEGNDAECITYDELELGGYYYSEESISPEDGWLSPKYNDQVSITVDSLDDFLNYSGELFDDNTGNDEDRNQNSDGHIVLTENRPSRTLVILNQMEEEPQEVCEDIGPNLVENGNFEEDNVTDNGGEWQIFDSIIGWLDGKAEIINGYEGWLDSINDTGVQFATLDVGDCDCDGSSIYQNITTTIGKMYKVSFEHSAEPGTGSGTNNIEFYLDGTPQGPFSDNGISNPNTSWTTYTDTFVATGTLTEIKFTGLPVIDGAGNFLDNVVVAECNPEDEEEKAYVRVIKNVINDDEGEKDASDFWIYTAGNGHIQGDEEGVVLEYNPGENFHFYEFPAFGYEISYEGCSGKAGVAGETKTCTITNNDPENVYAPYCGDGKVNQTWEACDGGESCTAQCQNENECVDMAFAKVTVTDVLNNTEDGMTDGDMTDDVFLGGNSFATNRIPSGTWFLINDGTNYIDDVDMEHPSTWLLSWAFVPGMAVERSEGTVQLNMMGYHNHNSTLTGNEFSKGTVEYFPTSITPTSVESVGPTDKYPKWKLEKEKDGLTEPRKTDQDEIWIDGDIQKFVLGVSPSADSFYAEYDTEDVEALDCDGGNNNNNVCEIDFELIKNGGFENPEMTNGNGWDIFPSGTVTLEWIATWLAPDYDAPATANIEIQEDGLMGWTTPYDNQWVELDSDYGFNTNESSATKISQDIATELGATYKIKYAFGARPGVVDNAITVRADGAIVDTQSDDGTGDVDITWLPDDDDVTFTATDTTTTISFENTDTSDSLGSFLDNVSVKCIEDSEEEEDDGGNGDDNDGEEDDNNTSDNGGGGGGGSSHRSGSVAGGEVLGDGIGGAGEVLGESLAETGTENISYLALSGLILAFLFATKRRNAKI